MLWWLFLIVSLIIGYQMTLSHLRAVKEHLQNVMNNKHQEIIIKKVGSKDFDQILDLLKTAAQSLKDRGIDQWSYWLDPPKERLEWAQQGCINGEFYFITFRNQIIGMYRLCKEDLLYWGEQEKSAYYIHSFVIHPRYKGLQVGRYIIQQIEKQARKDNIRQLRLDCNETNPGLCQYYINQGFEKVGEKQMKHSLNNLYEKILF